MVPSPNWFPLRSDLPFCHLSPLMPSTSHDSIGFLSHFLASLVVEMAIPMVSSSIQCNEKSVERFSWKMIAVLTEEVTCSGHCPLLLLQVPSEHEGCVGTALTRGQPVQAGVLCHPTAGLLSYGFLQSEQRNLPPDLSLCRGLGRVLSKFTLRTSAHDLA